MSLFLLNHDDNCYTVLDANTLDVKNISIDEYNNLVVCGEKIDYITTQNSPLGLVVKDNIYELHFTESGRIFYNGIFPTQNMRNNLFEHDIKISQVGVVDDTIVIKIDCKVYCKYDIELPMTMVHILAIPILGVDELYLGQCFMSAYTSEPVLVADESTLQHQYEQCEGDYPKLCLIDGQDKVIIDDLNFYGLSFDIVPIYVDLCRKLQFYKF